MQPESLQEALDWVQRAERDLRVAARLLGPEVFPEAAAYHAQQAAEKALKAYLAAHARPLPRTHDLVRLIALCEKIDGSFASLLSAAQTLTPYATQFRYPGGPFEPEPSQAEEAVRLAEEVARFVQQRIST